MAVQSARPSCIYCGRDTRRVRQGEHIIPKAVGGALTIKNVCGACNNGFSRIDTELCSRSPLSIVASHQIDAHLWQVWDVDHSADHLLLEARPDWTAESLTQYPQIVFESSGPQLHGDYEEVSRFGRDNFERVFVRAMLRAFRRYEAGAKRWLHFERVERNQLIERGYRLPPRLFARTSIQELANRLARDKRASFVLRYQTEDDSRFALNALDTWSLRGTFRSFEGGVGSELPVFGCHYDAGKVFRALTKLAINLLSHCCPNSPINCHELGAVVRVVTGEAPVSPQLLAANGFVHASDVEPIKADGKNHSFRLLHMDGDWRVYSSFFGGRIGSFVRFPGPNRESWSCADLVAPLRSNNWKMQSGRILRPLKVHIEWQDMARLVPTIKMLHSESKLIVERAATTV